MIQDPIFRVDSLADTINEPPSGSFSSFTLDGSEPAPSASKPSNRRRKRNYKARPALEPLKINHESTTTSNGLLTPQTPSITSPLQLQFENITPGLNHGQDHSPDSPPLWNSYQLCGVEPAVATPGAGHDPLLSPITFVSLKPGGITSPEVNFGTPASKGSFNNPTYGGSLLFSHPVHPLDAPAASHSTSLLGSPAVNSEVPRLRQAQRSRISIFSDVLGLLGEVKMTPTDLLCLILSGEHTFLENFRLSFYSKSNEKDLRSLFSTIWSNEEKGRPLFKSWMSNSSCAVDVVCEEVRSQMEQAKPFLSMTAASVNPDFIFGFDISRIMGPICKGITPTFTKVIRAAAEPRGENADHLRNQVTEYLISAQVHFLRSFRSCKVQMGLGLAASAMGVSRQLMNILSRAGLSVSQPTVNEILDALANHSISKAKLVASGPHALAYDNINLSSSIFVEQTPNAMNKVQSGTLPLVYELLNALFESMKVGPMLELNG